MFTLFIQEPELIQLENEASRRMVSIDTVKGKIYQILSFGNERNSEFLLCFRQLYKLYELPSYTFVLWCLAKENR